MKTQYIRFFLTGIFACCGLSHLFAQEEKAIIQAIKAEVDRNKSELKIKDLLPPFYIRYAIVDNEILNITACEGSISTSSITRTRDGLPFVLVGDFFNNNMGFVGNGYNHNYPERMPIENSGIATAVWSAVDRRYKQAAVDFELKKVALEQQKQTEEDKKVASFEQTTPPNLLLARTSMNMDQGYWEDFLKKSSEVFKNYPELTTSKVDLHFRNTMVYYYDTENGQYAVPVPYYLFKVTLSTQANDGQELNNEWFFEHSYAELMPDLQSFIGECKQLTEEFIKLKNAPLVTETYSGPVLFEDFAALQTVQHEFFMSRLLIASNKQINASGMSVTRESEAESMIGRRLISKSLNMVSLSGTEVYNDTRLDGYYPMDFTGVAPDKEMFLIEKGIVKTLLTGKAPSAKIAHSNGHERFSFPSGAAFVMPGNVRLYSDEPIVLNELKQQLITAAKEENYNYAYIVRRYLLGNQTFLLYRVSVADGKEELVRGGALRGLNHKSFKNILGVSKEEFIGNHTAMGQMATLVVPKGILFENIEVVKDNLINKTPPYIVPKP